MNYAIHRISLDVTDDSPSQLTISAKQGDRAKKLIISLLDDKKNYQIARGSVASFVAKKANGIWLEHDCDIDFDNNKVIYTFQEKTVSTPVTLDCEIHLAFAKKVTKEYIDDEGKTKIEEEIEVEKLTTASFVIAVHDNILSGLTTDTEETMLLPNLISTASGLVSTASGLFDTLKNETIPNAIKATEDANTATTNANEAADLANGRANYAGAQGDYALAQGDYAKEQGEYIENFQERVNSGELHGVSVTHSWDGTTLNVTSASGTSSADLKGEKGEKGEKGDSSQDFIEHNTGKLVKMFVGTVAEWTAYTGDKNNMLFIPLGEGGHLNKLYRHDIYMEVGSQNLPTNYSNAHIYLTIYSVRSESYDHDALVEWDTNRNAPDSSFISATGNIGRGNDAGTQAFHYPIYKVNIKQQKFEFMYHDGFFSTPIYTYDSVVQFIDTVMEVF